MNQHIVIISASFPPEKGAAPTRVYNLAHMLQAQGCRVEVITAMPNYPTGRIFPGYRGKFRHSEQVNGIQVYRTWIYPSNSKNIFKRVASIATHGLSLCSFTLPRLLRQKPDLVIVNTPPFLTGYAGIRLARMSGCKVLLNVSDLWPLSLQELGALRPGPFYRFLERLEKKMYRNAHAYTGQSEAILAHIRTIAGQPKNMFLYRNLQGPSAFAPQPRANGSRSIVYAGLLGVAQGVYDICKAIDFAALGVSFHIYGDGNEKEKIQSLISRYPERNIFYHGSVPAADIPEVLSHYHSTLIPLRTEIKGALPSKVFMAVANGLPALYCGGGEGAAIVRENSIGWVSAPGNYEQLKENINALAQADETAYTAIRNRCLELAQTTFNKQVQDEAFCTFISSL
jgi:glycosyltransferase involved in cell wall biosynthesis